MLSKCSNPDCSNPFLYLRDGRLFQIEIGSEQRTAESALQSRQAGPSDEAVQPWREVKSDRHVEFFWLCGRCSTSLTLAYDKGHGVNVVPLPMRAAAA